MDSLTGLYNRGALQQALEEMTRGEAAGYLVMSDLDHFKQLNDTYGHIQGDQCLQKFANILREEFLFGSVFRYGGDEFCIIILSPRQEDVFHACQSVQQHLHHPVVIDGRCSLQASFGVAKYVPGVSAEELLQQADEALYRSKTHRNAIRFYGE